MTYNVFGAWDVNLAQSINQSTYTILTQGRNNRLISGCLSPISSVPFLPLFPPPSFRSSVCNCNCNWGTCIAPPTERPRVHHRVNPYPGVRRQNETEMFSDHNETSPSIAAVSAPSGNLFHARGAATEKALSSIRRHVRGMTRLPHNGASFPRCCQVAP